MSGLHDKIPPADIREALSRVRRAQGEMPYGGLVQRDLMSFDCSSSPRPSQPSATASEVVEAVADYLEQLRDVLKTVAKNNEAERTELQHLQADLAAAGRLLARIMPGSA